MKKILSLILIITTLFLFISCSKEEIKEPGIAGAYALMFKELIDKEVVNLQKYKYLCFDTATVELEEDDLAFLCDYIKKQCEKLGVKYMEGDIVSLRRAFMIDTDIYGEVFTQGYILRYSQGEFRTDINNIEYYTAQINFWHGNMDGVGATDFYLINTDSGWYIDRERSNGGYNLMHQ